jgi:hypothetical protein
MRFSKMLIQAYGSGHSQAFAMELANRAGGLVPANRVDLLDLVEPAGFGGGGMGSGEEENQVAPANIPESATVLVAAGAYVPKIYSVRLRLWWLHRTSVLSGAAWMLTGFAAASGPPLYRHPYARFKATT